MNYTILLSFLFPIPHFWRSPFPYIVTWIASQTSTWIASNPHLDACPIKALLEVVEYATSCKGTVQEFFAINAAN